MATYIQMDDSENFMDTGAATMDGELEVGNVGSGTYSRSGGVTPQNFQAVAEADLVELAPGVKV